MLGGGGIGEHEASAVTGGGGPGEQVTAVSGGGGTDEQDARAVAGGGISSINWARPRLQPGVLERLGIVPAGIAVSDQARRAVDGNADGRASPGRGRTVGAG
jgi:hypothetical protein